MDVIFDAAHDDRLAIQVGQNSAQITMQFITESFVLQKGPTFFGLKHGVNQDFCKGLWHAGNVIETCAVFNPFRVDDLF